VDISGERLRGSEQFRADGDSSEVNAGREQTSTQSNYLRPVTDSEGNLRPERPLKLKDFI